MKTKNLARRIFGALATLTLGAAVGGCGGQNKSEVRSAKVEKSAPKIAMKTAGTKPVAGSANAKNANTKNASAKSIVWATSFEAARAQAKSQNKALMIDFYTDWCSACKLLDAEIYPNAAVVKTSRGFVNVKVNAEQRTDIAQQYGVTAFPTIIWVRADGIPVLRQDGVSADTSEFVTQMNNAHSRYAALSK